MRFFKNLKEIWQTWKKFRKNEWQPCYKKLILDILNRVLHGYLRLFSISFQNFVL